MLAQRAYVIVATSGAVDFRDDATIMVSNGDAVFLVGADGSGVRAHIEETTGATFGSWSPDNSRIAILSVLLPRRDETIVLSTVAPDGTDRRVLVRFREEQLVGENPAPKRPGTGSGDGHLSPRC